MKNIRFDAQLFASEFFKQKKKKKKKNGNSWVSEVALLSKENALEPPFELKICILGHAALTFWALFYMKYFAHNYLIIRNFIYYVT